MVTNELAKRNVRDLKILFKPYFTGNRRSSNKSENFTLVPWGTYIYDVNTGRRGFSQNKDSNVINIEKKIGKYADIGGRGVSKSAIFYERHICMVPY